MGQSGAQCVVSLRLGQEIQALPRPARLTPGHHCHCDVGRYVDGRKAGHHAGERYFCELDNAIGLVLHRPWRSWRVDLGAATRRSDRVQRSGVRAVRILGIVAKTHDSGLALLKHGVPEFVLEEERFNRIKKTNKFPKHSVKAAFSELAIGIGDVDAITTPWDIRQLRRTYLSIVGGRFPLSLSFLVPRSHVAQQNQIVLLNQLSREGPAGAPGRPCAAPDRQRGPPPLARRHVLRLALRRGAGAGHGRLWRRQLEQRLSRARQHARAALVDQRDELGRARLHVRHAAPGLCRLRRRRQGDGARRLRREHLRQPLPRRHQAHARRRLCRQHGLFQLRRVRRAQAFQAQVPRHVRADPAARRAAQRPAPRCRFRPAGGDGRDRRWAWCAPCSRSSRCAICAWSAASRSTAWPTPRSSSRPTCGASGCRRAPPTPAPRSAARFGTTTRRSATRAASR